MKRDAGGRNAAQRAEPRGVGTGRSRDPLAREVKLLGSLLGQVIVEQEGPDKLELIERVRRRAIALRRLDDPSGRSALADELEHLSPDDQAILIRAFGLYFGLINLAERRHQTRLVSRRSRRLRDGPVPGSIADTTAVIRRRLGDNDIHRLVADLAITPVLTAHPTEARRRTIIVALGRCARLIERLDDPRLTTDQDREVRRRLREEIAILWRTADLRAVDPTPLDEVRTAMVFFDETLFSVVARLYRAVGDAVPRPEPEPALWPPAFLRLGSWVGADRDGHPAVTAEITVAAMRIQVDHVLRGYEAVCQRLMQAISATVPDDRVDPVLAVRLDADRVDLPSTMRTLERRFPHEPYRKRLGAMAERVRRTRAVLVEGDDRRTGAYEDAESFRAELTELADALVRDGLDRAAGGEVADLRWQLDTFGFHLASLEVRQHAAVHREAIRVVEDGAPLESPLASAAGISAGEVLATFRAMAELQRRFGEGACSRYIVSFTASPADIRAVLELARLAGADDIADDATSGFPPARPRLDVVPLLESAEALGQAGPFLDALLADPVYAAHLAGRSGQEVMLGYSDSNLESGFLAASWLLYRAQEQLVDAATRAGVSLTIFHGRGGAIGRGGGPMERAIVAMAPGAVAGRLKLTEQGEVIAARYGDRDIALRELELMTGATLRASTPEHDAEAAVARARGAPIMDELAREARDAYRALVWEEPAFAPFFDTITPIREIASLRIGSRPASRRRASAMESQPSLDGLRAIPWVFAWSQSRIGLPGWFGLGAALDGYLREHRKAGLRSLQRLYRTWPFFASVLDNAELALARSDIGIGREYARLADEPSAVALWSRIESEHALAISTLLRVTGRSRLLDDEPDIRRSIELRAPYVDPLSLLQVRLMRRLRARPRDDPATADDRHLVQLTINGVAAGILTTG